MGLLKGMNIILQVDKISKFNEKSTLNLKVKYYISQ